MDRRGWRRTIMKSAGSLLPEHEGLRRAVQWLTAQTSRDARTIEEASRRFDLSPIDEEFLLQHFRHAGPGGEDTIAPAGQATARDGVDGAPGEPTSP